MAQLNHFMKLCSAIILVLVIIYLGSQVDFIFKPILSLITVITVPVMIAVFFYYLLRPLVNVMEKWKIKRSLAILLIYLAVMAILIVLSILVWPSLRTQLINLVNNAPELFESLRNQLQQLEQEGFLSGFLPKDANPLSQLSSYLDQGFTILTDYVSKLFSLFSSIAILFIICPIILFYLLKDGDKFLSKMVAILPMRFRGEGRDVADDIDNALSGFIVGRVIINLALGVLMYIGFLIIDLPYALLLTVVAVILNFIPFIGSFLSSIPIVIIGFIESPAMAIWSIVIITIAQQIQDNLIAPYVYGKQLDIHPLTTVVLVLVGGDLAGIIGILLIIPLYMIFKIIVIKVYKMFFKRRWENA